MCRRSSTLHPASRASLRGTPPSRLVALRNATWRTQVQRSTDSGHVRARLWLMMRQISVVQGTHTNRMKVHGFHAQNYTMTKLRIEPAVQDRSISLATIRLREIAHVPCRSRKPLSLQDMRPCMYAQNHHYFSIEHVAVAIAPKSDAPR